MAERFGGVVMSYRPFQLPLGSLLQVGRGQGIPEPLPRRLVHEPMDRLGAGRNDGGHPFAALGDTPEMDRNPAWAFG